MKRARVACFGAVHDAVEFEGKLKLADGRVVEPEDVVWLSPVEAGTIFVLGLNYADHASEISFNAPDEPLVFLKGPNALIGHNAFTRRPDDAIHMHYECELAVVLGRTARDVSQADAYDYIAGYTVANDYTIRDYLENYYRPNLRVKNRDTLTPIGPWFVDASGIPDPMNLAVKTYVNGELTQDGCTKDMVFDIPYLIAYLSSFMTLREGDIILTGTPKGTVHVYEGDEVVTEIEGIGALKNTIVGDVAFART
ncbi:4-hydroxyphenylacetate degradation bifunctional isomerase/decarboxylase [Lentibacillus sp. JNUCC-1]|uniref:fumarylacetoacetate hydrolase family protein n=1 Tax=Lentibacillus sp. JNUCC-1 TaxID=2654513 RepID=UPI0012E92C70|nr:fumarylacetoacetate hydrolase family protein [Lentibacillus sp. JNUCC-1]MUV39001.1 4-hydroxyphenylacetate degradation bifunctional isomerase/decarboxylase [Lentibacillus sp. JNUCC-1]